MSDEKCCGTCRHYHPSASAPRGYCCWSDDTDTPFWMYGSSTVDPIHNGWRCHTWEAKR